MVLLGFRRLLLFVGFALLHLSASVPAQAAILTAIEDNFVLRSGTGPTTTQGNGNQDAFTLKETALDQPNARFAYLKFDLDSIAPSINNESTFSITSTGNATTDYVLRVYALNPVLSGFDWSESTITYNNRPAYNNSSFPLVDLSMVTQVGTDKNVSSGTALGTTHSFSFANLDSYRQSDNTLTLIAMITDQVNGSPSFNFASSENGSAAFRPTLNVTAIPEPTTLGLLGFGLAGCILWRLRK